MPIDPLERAEENARAYQDLARAEARRLPEYEADDEESTARHDIPPPAPQPLHIHVHQDSIHDDERETLLPELPKKGPARWVAIGIATLLAAFGTWLSGKLGGK